MGQDSKASDNPSPRKQCCYHVIHLKTIMTDSNLVTERLREEGAANTGGTETRGRAVTFTILALPGPGH